MNKSLLETFLNDNYTNGISFSQLLDPNNNAESKWDEFFNNTDNIMALLVLELFKYNYKDLSYFERITWKDTLADLEKKHENEKIDRFIWKLTANGKSEYTDIEKIFKDLFENVLSGAPSTWDSKYDKFQDKWYAGDISDKDTRDNKTIQLMGISYTLTLCKYSFLVKYLTEKWLTFLEFFFQRKKYQTISLELIEALLYFNITERKVLMRILAGFNRLPINGNMNKSETYKAFLKKYLKEICAYSLHHAMPYASFDSIITDNKELNLYIFDTNLRTSIFLKKLETIKKRISVSSIKKDIVLMIEFIQKNRVLISCKEECPSTDNKSSIKISFSSSSESTNNAQFNELNNIEDDDLFFEKLDKEYQNNTIKFNDIFYLNRFKALNNSLNNIYYE